MKKVCKLSLFSQLSAPIKSGVTADAFQKKYAVMLTTSHSRVPSQKVRTAVHVYLAYDSPNNDRGTRVPGTAVYDVSGFVIGY